MHERGAMETARLLNTSAFSLPGILRVGFYHFPEGMESEK